MHKIRFFTFSPFFVLCLLNMLHAQRQFNFSRLAVQPGHPLVQDRGPDPCPPDSTQVYVYPSPGDSILAAKRTFTYYGTSAVVRREYELDGGSFILGSIDSTRYDGLGRVTLSQHISRNSSTNELEIDERILYFPRGTGNLLDSTIRYETDFFSGNLEPEERVVYHYDANERLLQTVTSGWSTFDNLWYEGNRDDYHYNIKNLVDSIWTLNPLNILIEVKSFEYYPFDSLKTVLIYNALQSAYTEKDEYTYDLANHISRAEAFNWDQMTQSWVFGASILRDYRDDGLIEAWELVFNFFGQEGVRYEYRYKPNTDCIHYVDWFFKEGNDPFEFVAREYYRKEGSSSLAGPSDFSVELFPNPTESDFYVRGAVGANVQVIDQYGRIRHETVLQGDLERISPGLQQNGLYWIVVERAGGRQVGKLVFQR